MLQRARGQLRPALGKLSRRSTTGAEERGRAGGGRRDGARPLCLWPGVHGASGGAVRALHDQRARTARSMQCVHPQAGVLLARKACLPVIMPARVPPNAYARRSARRAATERWGDACRLAGTCRTQEKVRGPRRAHTGALDATAVLLCAPGMYVLYCVRTHGYCAGRRPAETRH